MILLFAGMIISSIRQKKSMKKLSYIIGVAIFLISYQATAQNQIDWQSNQQNISELFPNPAMSNVTIVLQDIPTQAVYIDIVDFNGNLQRSYRFSPGNLALHFDVSFLPKGHYIIRVRDRSSLIDISRLVKS